MTEPARTLISSPHHRQRYHEVGRVMREARLAQILLLVVLLRLALGLFGAASLLARPAYGLFGDWGELALLPGQPGYLLTGLWQRWDALWYLKIALDGYSVPASTAFFPLYPATMRLVGFAFGGDLTLGGLVVATTAFVVALLLLRQLVAKDFSPAAADRTVLYLALFPTAFFFLAPFTESLFLLLAVAALYGARTGRWWLAAGAGLLAGLTRAQGVLLVLPLLFEYIRQNRRLTARTLAGGVAVLLPAASWLAFTAYVVWFAGGGLPGRELRDYWGYQAALPWQVIAASWDFIAVTGDRVEMLNLASLAIFSLAAFAGLGRLPFAYFLYVMPQLALLMTRQMYFSPLMSTGRYVLPLFPAFVVLALYTERRIVRWPILIVFVLLMAYYFFEFVHWGFVA